MTNLDVELLRTLVAFADSGSFRSAAHLVHRTPSAISMQMRRLEDQVHGRIFVRKGRTVALTDQGLRLAVRAREFLENHDRLLLEFRGGASKMHLRIGIPDDYALLLLPSIMKTISATRPGVSYDIVANTSPVLMRMLGMDELDFAVLATELPARDDVVLQRDAIVWVGSREIETHRKRPLVLALFADESPVYRATVAALRDFRDNGHAVNFRIGVRSGSHSVLCGAALAGEAVATMVRSAVIPSLRILGPEEGFPPVGELFIVVRASATADRAVSLLTRALSAAFEPARAVSGSNV